MASRLTSRRLFGFFVTFCLFLIAALPTFSQSEDAEPFAESIDVERVNVDVWVTNRAGEPMDRLPWKPHHVLSDLTTIPQIAGAA